MFLLLTSSKLLVKKKVIILLIVCFQTKNIIVPTIDLIIGLSPLEFHTQS
jgi:hypothetical protein